MNELATRIFSGNGNTRRRHACPDSRLSRYELENYMVRNAVLTTKWMSARLGMTNDSFSALLSNLDDIGMHASRYLDGEFIAESFADDLVRHLPRMRLLQFSDNNRFCEILHQELHKVKSEITPLICATSKQLASSDVLADFPVQFASYFDCITCEPLSTRHSLWLDFRGQQKKPLNLPPDRCSKLYYVQNRDALRPHCAGTTEPEDLAKYELFLASVNHG
jgi:hypothetical protein